MPGFIADQLPPVAAAAAAAAASVGTPDKSKDPSSRKDAAKPEHANEWMMASNFNSTSNIVRAAIQVAKETAAREGGGSRDAAVPSISGISQAERQYLPERIVMVGSILSMMSFIGYSAYSASKYAIRGLADSLRSELLPLGIKVHFYFPGNIDTPGYEAENKIKPSITRELEGSSTLISAESTAQFLCAGVLNDRFSISNDYLGELIRIVTNSTAPRPNMIPELFALPLIGLIFSAWGAFADYSTIQHFRKKQK
eukprot:jgi/Hompol1/1191/HPOL_005540-RA